MQKCMLLTTRGRRTKLLSSRGLKSIVTFARQRYLGLHFYINLLLNIAKLALVIFIESLLGQSVGGQGKQLFLYNGKCKPSYLIVSE